MKRFSIAGLFLLSATWLAACSGSGATIGSSSAATGGASGSGSSPAPGTHASGAPGAPTATPSPAPGASATATSASGSPAPTATIDLTCDRAPYPSTTYVSCEATNYAMTEEASEEEASNTTFETQYVTQGQENMAQWEARALADPSWLDPLSGDTTNTPACTTWNLVCVGDPFRYPDVTGPDGSAFYTNEATVTPVVFYDDGCARLSGRVWIPKTASIIAPAPEIVIDNGSIQAPETLYWPQAQALVRAGYAVLTFDPRGQGRSDEMTPTGGQGSNIDDSVFWTGLVNAIDFMHSSPTKPYPEQTQCKGTYPTVTAAYNPEFSYVDNTRTGIAGHSAGAVGVSIVQGYGGPGAAPWPGKLDATNPVKVAVAWDGLRAPAGGDVGGIGSSTLPGPAYPAYAARVPSMGQSSEYGLAPVLFATPPPTQLHLDDYKAWVAANVPVYEMTYRGSTHYDFSLLENFPATSWCPDTSTGACTGGWADLSSQYYTVAWFDRWLKNPGEQGYADADARLLNDFGVNGANKMSYHFYSARNFTDRIGTLHHCIDIRAGCGDATSPAIDALRATRPQARTQLQSLR